MTNKFFTALTTLALAGALMLTALAQGRQTKPTEINPNLGGQTVAGRSKKVMLPCANGGGHQDVSKGMDVTNNSGQTLKTNMLIYYSASDGDKGQQYPDTAVATGKAATVHGKPGQNYTCQAWVYVQ